MKMCRIRYSLKKKHFRVFAGAFFILLFFELYHLHRTCLPARRMDMYDTGTVYESMDTDEISQEIYQEENQKNDYEPVQNKISLGVTVSVPKHKNKSRFKTLITRFERVEDSYKRFRIEKSFPFPNNTNMPQHNMFSEDVPGLSRKLKVSKFTNISKMETGETKKLTYVKFSLDLSPEEVSELFDETIKWFHVDGKTAKDELLNRHKFMYRLNSNVCVERKTDILIIIHSGLGNIAKRTKIRNTWGSLKVHGNVSLSIVFVLGEQKTPHSPLQKNIEDESKTFRDIVQGNFIDSYKNMTYKHVMALRWITSHCSDVRTVVKIDDDVFVDVYKLADFVIDTGHIHNNLYCSLFETEKPKRDGKWGMSLKEYPFPVYPTYCEGLAYIFSVDEARKLSEASEDLRFFWIDDTYVTGILARRAGIGHVKFQPGHMAVKRHRAKNESATETDKFMFFTHFEDWDALMIKIHDNHL